MKIFRIKWEKIITILASIFFVYCMIYHIVRNGFDINAVFIEFLVYTSVTIMNYYSVLTFRKSFK